MKLTVDYSCSPQSATPQAETCHNPGPKRLAKIWLCQDCLSCIMFINRPKKSKLIALLLCKNNRKVWSFEYKEEHLA